MKTCLYNLKVVKNFKACTGFMCGHEAENFTEKMLESSRFEYTEMTPMTLKRPEYRMRQRSLPVCIRSPQ